MIMETNIYKTKHKYFQSHYENNNRIMSRLNNNDGLYVNSFDRYDVLLEEIEEEGVDGGGGMDDVK